MREFFGKILQGVAGITMFGAGIVALIICFGITKAVLGPIGAFLGLALFPVLLTVSPVYALLAWGAWKPLALVYGGGFIVGIMFWLSSRLTGEDY